MQNTGNVRHCMQKKIFLIHGQSKKKLKNHYNTKTAEIQNERQIKHEAAEGNIFQTDTELNFSVQDTYNTSIISSPNY